MWAEHLDLHDTVNNLTDWQTKGINEWLQVFLLLSHNDEW